MAATIEIPGVGKKRFEDIDDFRNWLENEKKHYTWVEGRFTPELQKIREQWKRSEGSSWRRAIDQALKVTQEYKGHEWSDEIIEEVESVLKDHVKKSEPFWTETVDGEFIVSVKESRNDVCALGALTYLSNTEINLAQVSERDFWDGWIFAFLYSHGLQKSVPKHYRRIDTVATEFREELADLQKKGQGALASVNEELRRLEERRRILITRAQAHGKSLRRLRDAFRQVAKSEIEKQRRLVSEHIAMHSSVEYWSGKAKDFNREEIRWGRAYYSSVAFGTAVLLATVVTLFVLSENLLSDFTGRLALLGEFHLLLVGAIVIPIGMWLWATRMFGRLYLESRDRKEDAEHRVTAIQSYLAMLTDEKAFEKDGARELILPSIFGPPITRTTDAGGPPLWLDRIMRNIGAR